MMKKRTSPPTFQSAIAGTRVSNNLISGEKYWENVRRTLPSIELESIDKDFLKKHQDVSFHSLIAPISSIGMKQESRTEEQKELVQEENDEENEEDEENTPFLDGELEVASSSSEEISFSNSPAIVECILRRTNSCLNDEDVNALEEKLATTQHILRAQMLDIFKDIRSKVIYEYESTNRDLVSKYTKEITRLQTQVDDLTELVAIEEQRKQDQEVFLDRFSSYFVERCIGSIGVRRTGAIVIHFQRWKRAVELKKQSRYKSRIAMQYRHQKHLKRHFFDWRFHTSQLKLQKQTQTFEKLQKELESKIKQEFDSEIHQLSQALSEAKEEILQKNGKNRQLEDDLRRLFLKGVSLMNIEALQLFNSYHEQSARRGTIDSSDTKFSSSCVENKPETNTAVDENVGEIKVVNEDSVQMDIPVEEAGVSPAVTEKEESEQETKDRMHSLESPAPSSPPRNLIQQKPSEIQARLQELLSSNTRPATVSNPVEIPRHSTKSLGINVDTEVSSISRFYRQAWMHTSVSPGKTKASQQRFGTCTKMKTTSSTARLSSKTKSSSTRVISTPTILTANSTKSKSQQARQVERSSSRSNRSIL